MSFTYQLKRALEKREFTMKYDSDGSVNYFPKCGINESNIGIGSVRCRQCESFEGESKDGHSIFCGLILKVKKVSQD